MAVNAEEFLLKLKSNIAPVATKDERALNSLDAQVRAATRAMAGLDAKAAASAAAVAEQQQKVAAAAAAQRKVLAGASGSVDVASARAAQRKVAQEEKSLQGLQKRATAAKAAADAGRVDLSVLKAARPEMDKAAVAAKKAAESKRRWKDVTTQAGAAIHAMGGPLSTWLGKMQTLAPIAELGAGAIVALGSVALAVVLVGGLAAAYAALVQFGLGAAAARRDTMLLGDALAGVSRRPGQEFVAVVDQLARQVPIARDKLQEMAKELALLKLGGRDLQAGLTATAIVTSALGDSAGRSVRGIVEQSQALRRFTLGARDFRGEYAALAGSGMTKADVIGALAKQLGQSTPEVEKALLLGQVKLKDGLRALEAATKARFGSGVAAQMLDFDTQVSKAKESFAAMFNGVNVTPALEALRDFLKIFDQSTVSGKTMKLIVTAGFDLIVAAIKIALPLARDFFYGSAEGALELYIALAPTGYRVAKMIKDFARARGSLDTFSMGKAAVYVLAAAFGLMAVSIALAMVPLFLLIGAIYTIIKVAQLWWQGIKLIGSGIVDTFSSASDFLSSVDWSDLGTRIVDSLVQSVVRGAVRFAGAVKNLALAGWKAFTSTNEIHSPSRLYFRGAAQLARGAAGGVDAGAPLLARSVASMSMAALPQLGAGGDAPLLRAQGRGDVTVNFNGPVNIGGGVDSKEDFADFLIARITGARQGGAFEVGT